MCIVDGNKRRKLAWFWHVTRHDRFSKTILQGTLAGGRRRGQQRKCWMDNIKEWTLLPMPELLTRASCKQTKKKDWKRISAESSLMFPRRSYQSRDWGVLNVYFDLVVFAVNCFSCVQNSVPYLYLCFSDLWPFAVDLALNVESQDIRPTVYSWTQHSIHRLILFYLTDASSFVARLSSRKAYSFCFSFRDRINKNNCLSQPEKGEYNCS